MRMNFSPMILRFCSGSVTPLQRADELRAGIHRDQFGVHLLAEGGHNLLAARPAAADPYPRKRATSWSPIALCTSAAATDESTPPLTAASTRSLPTCFRMRPTASSMIEPGVQSGLRLADIDGKMPDQLRAPLGVCRTSGWNCTPKYFRCMSPIAAKGCCPIWPAQ